jgi:hypothetical protein
MRSAVSICLLLSLALGARAQWTHWVDFTETRDLALVEDRLVGASSRGGYTFDPGQEVWVHHSLAAGLRTLDQAAVCTDGAGTVFLAGGDASLAILRADGEPSRGFLEFREHPEIAGIRHLWGGDGFVLASHDIGVTRFSYRDETDEVLVDWSVYRFGAFGGQSDPLAAAPFAGRLVVATSRGLAVGEGYPDLPTAFSTQAAPNGLGVVAKAWLAVGGDRLYVLLRDTAGQGWLGSMDSSGSWRTLRGGLTAPSALAASGGRWVVARDQGAGSLLSRSDGPDFTLPQKTGALAFQGDTLWVARRPDNRPGGLDALVDGQLVGGWSPDVPGSEEFLDVDFAPDGSVWAAGVATPSSRNGIFQLGGTGWADWKLGYGVLANNPTSVCCDRQGGVWVGSWGAGCTRLDPSDSSRVTFTHNSGAAHRLAGFESASAGGGVPTFVLVTDVRQDDDDNIWIVNHQADDDSCLVVLPMAWFSDTSTAMERLYYDQALVSFPSKLDLRSGDGVWTGVGGKDTRDMTKRLLRLNSRGLPVTRLSEWRVERHQLADAVWNFDLQTEGIVHDVRSDGAGNTWIATSDGFYLGGLYGGTAQFSRVQFIDGLLSETLSCVEVDGRGRVWLGSPEGVNVYEPVSGVFREPVAVEALNDLLAPVEGLEIHRIRVHPVTGAVWVATNQGLFTSTEGARNYGSRPAGSVRMYPNPFRPDGANRARVLPEGLANDGRLSIYDANGRRLRTLSLLEAEAGWDGRDEDGELVASGVYLLLVTASGGSAEGKIAVIR